VSIYNDLPVIVVNPNILRFRYFVFYFIKSHTGRSPYFRNLYAIQSFSLLKRFPSSEVRQYTMSLAMLSCCPGWLT